MKGEEKQTGMKGTEIEILAGRGEKRKRGKRGIKERKEQRKEKKIETRSETRTGSVGKKGTERDWIKKIEILTKMTGGEVIDMKRIQKEDQEMR